MYRIAIIDDEERSIDYIEKIVVSYFRRERISFLIRKYENAENFIFDIKDKEYFDICLTDIEMPSMNGLEIAKQIKVISSQTFVVFVTSHLSYALIGYELNVYRYIDKSTMAAKLPMVLKQIRHEIEKRDKYSYIISTSFRYEKILISDILYIYKENKNVVLVTNHGESKVRKSVAQVFDELNSEDFIMIDRGIIANVNYILKVQNSEVVLKSGIKLAISRSHLQEIKRKVTEYWKEEFI